MARGLRRPAMILRPLRLLLALLVVAAPALLAQAPAAPAESAARPTPAELAYWTQLQKDLAELRTANLKAGIRANPTEATAENLSAIVSRLEQFLDRRDKDPVGDLGPEFKDYRERLMKLCDLALTPLTAAAKFKSTLTTQGQERMMQVFKIVKDVEAIDDYKPRLALLHDTINRRVIAAGGENRLFFQILGVGDKPRAPGALGSPEERDTQFQAAGAAIGPLFGDLARGHFIANRVKNGLTEGLMDPLIETYDKFRTQFADAPTDQLQEALKTASSLQEQPGTFNLKRHVLRLELMRRNDGIAYSIAMQEFQGAFRRWLGKANDIAPAGLCRDIAVSRDGTWFAYSPAEKTIIVRDTAAGKIRATIPTEDPVRSLAPTPDNQLIVFTTAGLFVTDPAAAEPKLTLRAVRKSAFLEGRLAAASKADRYAYGLGVMPAMARAGRESTFSVAKSASRITAVGISPDGLALAYGYAGDNITGTGEPRYGIDILTFDSLDTEIAEGGSIKTRRLQPPLSLATLAISIGGDGKRAAVAWFGHYGGAITLDDYSGEKNVQTIYTIDGDPYTWVQLVEGKAPSIVAGTRHGVVRVWDVASRDLLARFAVPAGPGGVAYTLLGDELVSVALGQSGVHRWKLADGTRVATYDGDTPKAEPSALAAERALHPARETLVQLVDARDNDARLKALATLRGPQAAMLDALGQRNTIDYWQSMIRVDQIDVLSKDKRFVEGFELGYKEIAEGVMQPYLVYFTLWAGNRGFVAGPNPDLRKRLLELGERAVALYPTEIKIQREYRKARADFLSEQGKIAEAMKEVDHLDTIDPGNAPHASRRYEILMFGYNAAQKGGRTREAMNHLIKALDYTNDKKQLLMLATNIFSLAYSMSDWKTAVNYANMALNLDPNQKNDQSFLKAAQYAYAQANPRPQNAAPQQQKKK